MTTTATLQAWLALEHQAVWLYPVIGARFERLTERARDSYENHLLDRDRLLGRLRDDGVVPVATALAYDVGPLDTPTLALSMARRLERSIAATCLALAGQGSGDLRVLATVGLRRAALAELTWGGNAKAFPGLP
ncbi:DUF4439 domain-containing protein [Aeromicrobium sp.]|uniref:DUF4439 domain-containing protein n=1 Tax=Aeromicrobium sp. TaxID=1871063 RepID=UPI0019A3F37C|nr:DUF4439 domain-containing protein [Aeromicrobium sp.]MBC7633131.1 DUF4439 domain-containing protein [Aeromicrobium sp.]